jgi:hypothetical protein
MITLTSAAANASVEVWEETQGTITQTCEIKLRGQGDSVEYRNFGTHINRFNMSVEGSTPPNERFTLAHSPDGTKSITFSDVGREHYITTDNSYSNCLSLDLFMFRDAKRMSQAAADRLLLKVGPNAYWDVCYVNYDGKKGICHDEKQTGFYDNGKPKIERGPSHECEESPHVEFRLQKRSIDENDELDLDRNPSSRLTIDSQGKVQTELEDAHFEASCNVTYKPLR